jgi:hypothetical protein
LIAGTKPSVCIGLLVAGVELASDPDTWRFTPEPVPTAVFREVEFFDFANNTWRAVDLAELNRFLQGYAVEKAKLEARKKGHTCFETHLEDGSIKVTVRVGGAA